MVSKRQKGVTIMQAAKHKKIRKQIIVYVKKQQIPSTHMRQCCVKIVQISQSKDDVKP